MFDFNWSEIALVAVVALLLIGPKDMPVAIRAVSRAIKKMRGMAGEFQHHVDDMMRDADMAEFRQGFSDLRSLNLKNQIARAVDPDRSLARALGTPIDQPAFIAERNLPADPAASPSPAFIPPGTAPPAPIQPQGAAPAFIPPAFIPPALVPPAFAPEAEPSAAPAAPTAAERLARTVQNQPQPPDEATR